MKQVAGFIKERIASYMAKNHPEAKLEIADISTGLLTPGRVEIHDVRFVSDKSAASTICAQIKKLVVEVEVLPLLKGDVRILRIMLESPRLHWLDTSEPRERKARARELKFECGPITLKNGEFIYERKGQTFVLQLEAQSKPFGRVAGKHFVLIGTGSLNTSKRYEFKLETSLFAAALETQITLKGKESKVLVLPPELNGETPVSFLLGALANAVT